MYYNKLKDHPLNFWRQAYKNNQQFGMTFYTWGQVPNQLKSGRSTVFYYHSN